MVGVQLEFVSARGFAGKSAREKVRAVLDAVRKGKILVVDGAFSPEEQKELISATMESVSKDFPGVEIASFGEENDVWSQVLKLVGGRPSGLTVIGPSTLVKQVKRNPTSLNVLAGK